MSCVWVKGWWVGVQRGFNWETLALCPRCTHTWHSTLQIKAALACKDKHSRSGSFLTPVCLSLYQMANESLPTPTQLYYSSCLKSNNFSKVSHVERGTGDWCNTGNLTTFIQHDRIHTHRVMREISIILDLIIKTNLMTWGQGVDWQQSELINGVTSTLIWETFYC